MTDSRALSTEMSEAGHPAKDEGAPFIQQGEKWELINVNNHLLLLLVMQRGGRDLL